tara:strand:+ start:375294 stop:375857 length:564 start_codon:yes stop_codon:yes gene_type:complete
MQPETELITLRDGRSIRLGPVEPEHAGLYRAYMMELADESPWTGTLSHEVKDEKGQRERLEKLRESPTEWVMGAFDPESNQLIADCGWHSIDYDKFRHVASLGIGILEPWRGVGLGRILMERGIQAARENAIVQKVELGVISDNQIARDLYESLGFGVEGIRKRAVKQPSGEFCDDVVMGLWIGGRS